MVRIKIFFILSVLILLNKCIYTERDNYEVTVSVSELKEGVLLEVQNQPFFLQEDRKEGEVFKVETPLLPKPLTVKVVKDKPKDGKNIIIPVEITDLELAKGVEIELQTKEGEKKIVKIPKRKIIIPQNFYVVLPGLGESGAYGGKDGALIIEVHPIMSFAFKVNINDTADQGLVCKVEYEDLFKIKVVDTLNKSGLRDINILTYIRTGGEEKWGINAENLLEARNPRKIDISRTEKLGKKLLLEARVDNVSGKENVNFGANLIYTRGNKKFNFGNVDRKVQDEFHFQTKITEKSGNYIFRLEGFDLKKTEENWGMKSVVIKRAGAQVNLELFNGLSFTTGNIRVETTDDDINQGTVDDKINSRLEYSSTFGALAPPMEKEKFTFSSSFGARIIQIDKDSWIRGRVSVDINYGPNSIFQFELNDDFINLTGKPYTFPWQNRRFTFICFHDLVEDKTIIGKLDLDYIFSEFIFKRTDYATPFVRTTRFRYGFGKSLKILKFALPLEFFAEKDYWMKDSFGITLSFRSWI